jgi:hypothetical protein
MSTDSSDSSDDWTPTDRRTRTSKRRKLNHETVQQELPPDDLSYVSFEPLFELLEDQDDTDDVPFDLFAADILSEYVHHRTITQQAEYEQNKLVSVPNLCGRELTLKMDVPIKGEVLRPPTRYEVSSLIQTFPDSDSGNSISPAASIVLRKLKLQNVPNFMPFHKVRVLRNQYQTGETSR